MRDVDRTSRPISVLLTALTDIAANAELAGRVQVVSTGECVSVRSLAELGTLLQRLAGDAVTDPS